MIEDEGRPSNVKFQQIIFDAPLPTMSRKSLRLFALPAAADANAAATTEDGLRSRTSAGGKPAKRRARTPGPRSRKQQRPALLLQKRRLPLHQPPREFARVGRLQRRPLRPRPPK